MREAGFWSKLSRPLRKIAKTRLDIINRPGHPAPASGLAEVASLSGAKELYLSARAMTRAGDLDGALPLFARAHELMPTFEDAAEAYGEGLDRSGQLDIAKSMYEVHRQLRGIARGAPPDRPYALQRVGRLTTEVAEYSRAAQLNGGLVSHYIYIARGNANLAMGNALAALVDYSAALGCDPGLVEAIALRGEALLMMGCYGEALQAFDMAIARRPSDPNILSGRAILHMSCGRAADAVADWRRQYALLPNERAAARACVALRIGDFPLARLELDRALEREPMELYWRLYRLSVARRIGEPLVVGPPVESRKWPAALVELHAGRVSNREVLVLADNPQRKVEAHYQIGILTLTGDPECARRHFQRVVELSQPTMIEHAASCHELMRWNKL